MSGFPNPIYEALALNISNLNKIPRQIRPESRTIYNYYISDTTTIDNRKTYVIKFKEINNKLRQNPRKYNGFIYVDAENYALKKIESNSKRQTRECNFCMETNQQQMVSGLRKPENKMGDQSFTTGKVQDSTKSTENRN